MKGGRNEKITVRVSPAEIQIIEREAEKMGMDISKYIRYRMFAKTNLSKYNAEYLRELQQLIYELNRIGNNVNQIAYRHNSNFYEAEDIKCIQDMFARCEELILNYVSKSK